MDGYTTLSQMQSSAGASFMPYGPPDGDVRIVETYGEYEAEYAAIRKGVGLFLTPQRGMIRVRGADRVSFINQLITNDARTLPPGGGCRAMVLNRHGRIVGDLTILHDDEALLLVTDVFQAPVLVDLMEKYIFIEDVEVQETTEQEVQLSLHGPAAFELLAEAAEEALPLEREAAPRSHGLATIAGTSCRIYRADETGAPGWHLVVGADTATAVFEALTEIIGGLVPEVSGGTRRRFAGRGIGWDAYNTARIEAGTPLFQVDYGPDSLPHETGMIAESVSFTKGCYPGQEIVARMENLGHPKQVLVGWCGEDDRLPVAGSPLRAEGNGDTVVGAVTSSTLSPLRGNTAVVFAMVRWDCREPGTRLQIDDGGGPVPGTVQGLCFMP